MAAGVLALTAEEESLLSSSYSDEARRQELLDLLYGTGATTLSSYQRSMFEDELSGIESRLEASTQPSTGRSVGQPVYNPQPSNVGIITDQKSMPVPGTTDEDAAQDYNNELLKQAGLAYNAGQIDMNTYSSLTQAIMAYSKAGEYYNPAGGSSVGGGYYTPYSSGSSSSGSTSSSSGASSQAYDDWYNTVMQAREDAMAKQEELYEQSKDAIDAAYQMGLMSETEYNNALTSARESLEAQYTNLKTATTESLYGQVNAGALEGRLADIDLSRISSLAGSERDIYAQQQAQNAQAGTEKARMYSQLFGEYQIPYPDIPAPNMGQYGGGTSTGPAGGYTGYSSGSTSGSTSGGSTSGGSTGTNGHWTYNAGDSTNPWTWVPETAQTASDPSAANFDPASYAMKYNIDPSQFEGWTSQDFQMFDSLITGSYGAMSTYPGGNVTESWNGIIPPELLVQMGKGTTPTDGIVYTGGSKYFDEFTGEWVNPITNERTTDKAVYDSWNTQSGGDNPYIALPPPTTGTTPSVDGVTGDANIYEETGATVATSYEDMLKKLQPV